MSLSVCQPNNTIAPLRRGFSHADVLPPLTKHRHDLTKMTLTISATSRKWSARHALPPSCPSTPFPLPLLTQTQNGSQGRFCAKEGHIKNDHLPAANSRRGHGGVYLSALYTNKKRRRIFPYGLSAGCARFCIVCCPPCPPRPPCPRCPCRPPRIIYGMADNRRTTDRGLCEFVVRPEKPDIPRVFGLGGQGGQHGQQGGQNRVLVRPLSA